MDYSGFRRSDNVEDFRNPSFLSAFLTRYHIPDVTDPVIQNMYRHPMTPFVPNAVPPAPPGSLGDQIGVNALPPLGAAPWWNRIFRVAPPGSFIQ